MNNSTTSQLMQQYQCPHCGAVLESDEPIEGMRVDCPVCGGEFIASAHAPGPAHQEVPPPVMQPRRGRSKWWVWVALALALAVGLGIFVFVGMKTGALLPAGATKTITLPGGATMEMVWCPPGTFTMGRPEGEEWRDRNLLNTPEHLRSFQKMQRRHTFRNVDYSEYSEFEEYNNLWWYKEYEDEREDWEMQHVVTLTKGFWIAKTEVTQAQWKSVMGNNPSGQGAIPPRPQNDWVPVDNVTWFDCMKFCKKAGLQLPTEDQWEYACRAGSEGAYGGTGDIDDMGWHDNNSDRHPHRVGEKMPNAWGIYDMHGNVEEWCLDGAFIHMRDSNDAKTDPGEMWRRHSWDAIDDADGWWKIYPTRIVRGGAYNRVPERCRSAARFNDYPVNWFDSHDSYHAPRFHGELWRGFRPVMIP